MHNLPLHNTGSPHWNRTGAASAPTCSTRFEPCPQPLCASECRVVMTRSQRKLLLAATLTLILAAPSPARSFTLDQLLDMPIEQLLRLEITSRHHDAM